MASLKGDTMGKHDIPTVRLEDIEKNIFKVRIVDRNYDRLGEFDLKTLSKKLWK